MSWLKASKIELNGKKVLYVDDEVYYAETDRQFFTLKSRLRPEDLLFADAFDTALETLEKHPEVFLVLVDLRIPKGSEDYYDYNPDNPDEEWGEKLIKIIIQKYAKVRKIKVIVVSAYTIYAYNNEDSSATILAFYSKPINFDSLKLNLEFIIKNDLESTQPSELLKEKKTSSSGTKSFDYSAFDEETSLFIQEKTRKIKKLAKRVAQDIIDIGRYLIEVKEKLGHGNFYDWMDAEFSWSYASAARFMQVANKFDSISLIDVDILPSALYQLAAPSAPEEAVTEAIERAKQGETITEKTAKAIKLKYKSSTKPTEEKVQPQNLEQSVSSQAETREKESQNRQRILPQGNLSQPSSSGCPQKTDKPEQEILAVLPAQKAVKNSWWQLGERHQLFCGEPKSSEFLERLPQDIALTINLPPNNDRSLIPDLKSRCSFSYYSEYDDLDLNSVKAMVENCILASTGAKDIVVFSYVMTPQLLKLAAQLGCLAYVAEPDLDKCEQILAIWREKNSLWRMKL